MLVIRNKTRKYAILGAWLTIILLLAAILMPLIWLIPFSHPQADDYSYSLWTNFFAYQKELYLGIGGRYFCSAIASLNPMNWESFIGYRVFLLLFLLFFCLTVIWFIAHFGRKLFGIQMPVSIALGVLVFFAVVNGLPMISEGLFWYSGISAYLLPFSLWLWWWVGLSHYHDLPTTRKMGGLSILLFLVIGGSEILMLLSWLGLGLWTFFGFGPKPKKIIAHWQLYLSLFLGTAIMFAAPGNQVRSGLLLQTTPDPTGAFYLSIQTYLLQANTVLLNPGFWLVVLLFGFSALRGGMLIIHATRLFWAFFLLNAGLIFCSLPNTYFTNSIPPGRFLNIIFLTTLLSYIALAGIVVQLLVLKGLQTFYRVSGIAFRLIPWTIFGLCLLAVIKFGYYRYSNYKIIRDEFGAELPIQYNKDLNIRYTLLSQSSNDSMTIPIIQHQSRVLFVSDIGNKASEWPNTDYAKYWGKKAIVATR